MQQDPEDLASSPPCSSSELLRGEEPLLSQSWHHFLSTVGTETSQLLVSSPDSPLFVVQLRSWSNLGTTCMCSGTLPSPLLLAPEVPWCKGTSSWFTGCYFWLYANGKFSFTRHFFFSSKSQLKSSPQLSKDRAKVSVYDLWVLASKY